MCLAVPGKITEIHYAGTMRMATIDFGGVTREACIEALPEATVGDWTIVHAGFALSLLTEDEALQTLDLLDDIDEFNEDNR